MQIQTILDHVQRKIQDSSYERSLELLFFVNMGLGELASEVVVPDLFINSIVTCPFDAFSVSMPADYYSNFIWAHNVTKDREVTIYSSLNIFLDEHSGLTSQGDVDSVCVHGGQLYYAPTPRDSGQDIRLWYCTSPTLFTDDGTEEITWLPEHLQGPLLINYAAMKVFEEIEDEGETPNFNKYFRLFSQAKGQLINFVGLPESKPEFMPGTDAWGA